MMTVERLHELFERHKEYDVLELSKMVEQEIADKYVSKHLVDKVYAKIVNEMEGWNSKYIPRLLQTVFYDLINEEIWNIVKEEFHKGVLFGIKLTLLILKLGNQ